jgi:hypothetical protein
MTPGEDGRDDVVLTPIGPRRGLGSGAILTGLLILVALGAVGRLVPPSAHLEPSAVEVAPSLEPGVRLVSPPKDVLYLRTTEVAVRGTAPGDIERLDVAVIVAGESIGEARIDVGPSGRFDGHVSIVPPFARSVGVLEVRDPDSLGRLLVQVSFSVQAGALVLPLDPATLRGTAGSTLVVDVLVYGPLREIRGLLTSVDGRLVATGSTMVGLARGGGGWPRTIGLSIEIPSDQLPDRARLHVLGFDQAETEVEHIDAIVALSNR